MDSSNGDNDSNGNGGMKETAMETTTEMATETIGEETMTVATEMTTAATTRW